SVQMPSGSRMSAPSRIGVAVSSPNSVLFNPSCPRIGTPITPNIVHTAKHTVNASVLASRTEYAVRTDGTAWRRSASRSPANASVPDTTPRDSKDCPPRCMQPALFSVCSPGDPCGNTWKCGSAPPYRRPDALPALYAQGPIASAAQQRNSGDTLAGLDV